MQPYKFVTTLHMLISCSTNPERPGDLKESFDVGAVDDENFVSSLITRNSLH